MEIRAAEISDIIKRQIQEYEREVEVRETGRVLSTGDGIARIYGLDKAAAGELLEFPHHIYGLVLNLEEDNVGAAIFGEAHEVSEGDEVRRTGRIAEVPVGEALLGRVVDALGQPIDGKAQGAGHRGATAGERTAADRHQGHRLDDSDRPRPARANHRRPSNR
jgi:F-type H+-transporting ATPase subunit alpha